MKNVSTWIDEQEYARLRDLVWHYSRAEQKQVSQSEVIRRALDRLFAAELLELKTDKLPLDKLVT